MGETLLQAQFLTKMLHETDNEREDQKSSMILTDESTVHAAIGILRQRINANTVKPNNEYYSPQEITPEGQKEFIDPLLHKAIGWLTKDELYANASDGDMDIRCLAICCDITTSLTSVFSPKHLGLGVHLYNDYVQP